MGGHRTIQEKKKGRAREPFVMIPCKWMDTPAWAHLNGNAVKLLLHLIRLSGGDNGFGGERGELFLSERGAARALGIARNTASAAFDLLHESGWIRPVGPKGHFNVKAGEHCQRATVWRLTFQPHPQTRRGPTLEFRDWRPEENCRAQKLNDTGAIVEPLIENEAETGAEIEPVGPTALSVGENSTCSIIEPHLYIATGRRSEGAPKNSGRPFEQPDEPSLLEIVRQRVEQYCSNLNGVGQSRLAAGVGLTGAELHQFIAGRLVVVPDKLVALRAATRSTAGQARVGA